MISRATIEKVRELDILDVVQLYRNDLKKAGRNWRGMSPFAAENTPSFYVVPEKNIFKDFSTGKGGNAITFVMEHQKLTYVESIKELCGKFSITCEFDNTEAKPKEYYEEIELLYNINKATAARYFQQLRKILADEPEHPAAQEITRRCFTEDTILQWQIGYAPGVTRGGFSPKEWRFLAETMVQKGFYAQGVELGLLQDKSEQVYDAYRHRLMFPIIDHEERYTAFGGRSLSPDTFNAKYINSADSRIFSKSRTLFGLNFATKAIVTHGYANLMEGFADVISFHQAGFNNTVGTCGTALTEEQCKLLKRFTSRLVLFYDGDKAGQAACLRSIDLVLAFGFEVHVVPMPEVEGKKVDPDELVRMFNNNPAATNGQKPETLPAQGEALDTKSPKRKFRKQTDTTVPKRSAKDKEKS